MFVAANGKVIYPSNISRYENCALFSFDDADTPMILYLKGDSYSRGYAYGKLGCSLFPAHNYLQ
jgi:hypothetical protein